MAPSSDYAAHQFNHRHLWTRDVALSKYKPTRLLTSDSAVFCVQCSQFSICPCAQLAEASSCFPSAQDLFTVTVIPHDELLRQRNKNASIFLLFSGLSALSAAWEVQRPSFRASIIYIYIISLSHKVSVVCKRCLEGWPELFQKPGCGGALISFPAACAPSAFTFADHYSTHMNLI